MPLLLLISRSEDRRLGPLPRRTQRMAWLAGVFFACDLVLWHHAIEAVGAGLATVLGNLQVLFVALLAGWLLGERPHGGLLLTQPLGAMVVAAVVLGQEPSVVQHAGAACILAGVVLATATRRRETPAGDVREPVPA